MTHSTLKPGFVKLYYSVANLQHTMTIPVTPASGWTVGVEPDLIRKNSASASLSTCVDELLVVLKPVLDNACDIGSAEAWFFPTGSDDPVWVYTYAIGSVGTGGASIGTMWQRVISFRTQSGGVYRFYIMEPILALATNTRISYPFGVGTQTNIGNYIIGATSWLVGRDNAPLVVPIWSSGKVNDALRRKRLLI